MIILRLLKNGLIGRWLTQAALNYCSIGRLKVCLLVAQITNPLSLSIIIELEVMRDLENYFGMKFDGVPKRIVKLKSIESGLLI